jgi:hypothetical protein
LIYEQAKIDAQEEREHANGLEQKVVKNYENIPKTAQRDELTEAEKID